MTHPTTPLVLEREGAVATIRFNRPQALNAIDVPMAEALLAAAQHLASYKAVRAVLMCGAGKGFMAGGDLETLRSDPVGGSAALLKPLNAALEIFHAMDAPIVAQVHGVAAGAGLSLMLQADFVLAAEGTRFNLAYVNIGTSCDVGASWALPRLVGLRRALEIAMLGETFDATAAERMGLINRVVPAIDLDKEAMALARRLAAGPTVAHGHLRRLMRTAFDRDLPAQLRAETQAFRECAGTEDFRSGVDAFFSRKPAQFVGH